MAGHRRRSGRPLLDHMREQRRLALLAERLDAATWPGDQVAAACDYLRGVLKHVDPDVAAEIAEDVVEQLTATGKQAFANRKRGAA